MRWRTATKCPCVEKNTQQPDPHCEKCGGRGFVYGFQESRLIQTTASVDNNGLLDVGSDYESDSLVKVYDQSGKVYTDAEKFDQFIDLKTKSFVRGSYYSVLLKRDIAKTIESTVLEDVGGGYYKVPGIESERLNIEGIYYKAPSDVVSIGSVTDEAGEAFEIEQYRLNLVYIPSKTVVDETTGEKSDVYPTGTLTARYVRYIEPFVFAVLNQNLNKVDFAQMEAAHGDAIVTYPYSCDVAENDMLTVFAGTITEKSIIVRNKKDYDLLPAFFVESISTVTGKETEYKNGVDYVLLGTNRIKWISDNRPEKGEGYSVTYKVYPTYSVIKNIPQLRSSENQRFPKKSRRAVLQQLQREERREQTMIKGITITIENEEVLQNLFSMANQISTSQATNAFPNTAQALYDAATFIKNAWKGWTAGEQIPGVRNIPRPDTKLGASIHKTPNEPSFSNYEIYSEHPLMADYQNGKDETIDMKAPGSPWLNGKKSRVNKKDGSPYLIVPFRWGTAGKTGGSAHFRSVVPKGIQTMLRRRALSKRLATTHFESNARGEQIERSEYDWGGRVKENEARHKDSDGNLTGYDVGMVRMWDSAYKNSNRGTYFTFRIISAKSAANKWIQHRHIDPIDVTGALKKEFERFIQTAVNDALMSDLT